MKRWISSVLAGAALALIVIGAPVALVAWGRLPRLDRGLVGPAADGTLLLGALTVVGWLAWAVFTVATVAEVVSLRSGRRVRLPGLRAVQRVAGGLLLLTLAVLPTGPTHQTGTRTVAASVVQPEVAEPAARVSEVTEAAPATEPYTVRAGDDLWTIAERLLGDGREWRRVAELNPSLADPTRELVAGSVLALPELPRALAAPAQPATADELVVRVHPGDTLSGLAQEHLGKAGRWPRIAAANPIVTDPDHIEIGWKLTIPGARRALSEHDEPTGGTRTAPDAPTSGDNSGAVPDTPAPDASSSTAGGSGTVADQPAATGQPAPAIPSASTASAPAPAPATPSATAAAPATPSASAAADSEEAAHPDDDLPLPAPLAIGTLAAAALVGALEARRALRERVRPLGRHQQAASAEADRLRTALRAEQRPAALTDLTAALRRVGRHCHLEGLDLPALAVVRVGLDSIELEWAEPAFAPPSGFDGDEHHWLVPLPVTDVPDQPCPCPALVSLGTAADGVVLLVDAERSRVLGVAGEPELQADALSAMGVELACAPWSREARLVVSGEGAELIQRAGEDRVQVVPAERALATLRTVVAGRRAALASEPLGRLRTDPDRAEAVAPYVFLFLDGLDGETLAELEALLDGDAAGVAVIVPTQSTAPALWQVSGDATRPDGALAGHPGSLAAHAISASARRSLGELLTEAEPVPAPWWAQDNVYPLPNRVEEEVDIVRLSGRAGHPHLLLIGPAELVDAGGPEPSRSRQQLVEMCAWLLENPGRTATQMAAGMALAEGTRRSNLSRLRAWLGEDADGQAYLPEAYSGRISLHPGIASDWQQLQVMLRPGVERVQDSTLVAALDLVRGAPLADAAPGQWYWAEELRTEMSAALRDVGVVLTERALRAHDLDLARWAASRALAVAPEDELLLCARLSTEYQAGNLVDCERLVNQLTRQAKILGVDLMPETVELCQRVIEGQLRARA